MHNIREVRASFTTDADLTAKTRDGHAFRPTSLSLEAWGHTLEAVAFGYDEEGQARVAFKEWVFDDLDSLPEWAPRPPAWFEAAVKEVRGE